MRLCFLMRAAHTNPPRTRDILQFFFFFFSFHISASILIFENITRNPRRRPSIISNHINYAKHCLKGYKRIHIVSAGQASRGWHDGGNGKWFVEMRECAVGGREGSRKSVHCTGSRWCTYNSAVWYAWLLVERFMGCCFCLCRIRK